MWSAVNVLILCISCWHFGSWKTGLITIGPCCFKCDVVADIFWCWYFTAVLWICDVGRSSGVRVVSSLRETRSSLSQFFSSSTSLVKTIHSSTARGRTVAHPLRCSNTSTPAVSLRPLTYLHCFADSVVVFHRRSVCCRGAHCSCLLTQEFHCL